MLCVCVQSTVERVERTWRERTIVFYFAQNVENLRQPECTAPYQLMLRLVVDVYCDLGSTWFWLFHYKHSHNSLTVHKNMCLKTFKGIIMGSAVTDSCTASFYNLIWVWSICKRGSSPCWSNILSRPLRWAFKNAETQSVVHKTVP